MYGMPVVVIPTHRPMRRIDRPDVVFFDREAKDRAIVDGYGDRVIPGRPVLVGTRTVMESEHLARRLQESGVACVVLNARNDDEEARIVARAGALDAVTIATNMAGRGTDIGSAAPTSCDRDRVVALGELYVISTSRHESRRVDRQLRGRAGRQGDPGESRFFLSLDDDLLARYGLERLLPPLLRVDREAPSISLSSGARSPGSSASSRGRMRKSGARSAVMPRSSRISMSCSMRAGRNCLAVVCRRSGPARRRAAPLWSRGPAKTRCKPRNAVSCCSTWIGSGASTCRAAPTCARGSIWSSWGS